MSNDRPQMLVLTNFLGRLGAAFNNMFENCLYLGGREIEVFVRWQAVEILADTRPASSATC